MTLYGLLMLVLLVAVILYVVRRIR